MARMYKEVVLLCRTLRIYVNEDLLRTNKVAGDVNKCTVEHTYNTED